MRKFFRFFYRIALRVIPKNRLGDKFFAFITFLWTHKRLPTEKALFNDILYKIKTTHEILDPLRVFVSDKEFVKIYVKAIVGDKFNVPTLKVLHSINEARAFNFPSECCIKPTHMSARVILRRNNQAIDLEEIESWFSLSHYDNYREVNYKTLRPKVIVEPLIFESDNLLDYKIFCYEGKPRLIQVDMDRHIEHTRKFLDLGWNELPFSLLYPRSNIPLDKPNNLAEMLSVASSLSSHFGFVRVDLYSNGKECLVGEITNCHGNGWENFLPNSAEVLASEMCFADSR